MCVCVSVCVCVCVYVCKSHVMCMWVSTNKYLPLAPSGIGILVSSRAESLCLQLPRANPTRSLRESRTVGPEFQAPGPVSSSAPDLIWASWDRRPRLDTSASVKGAAKLDLI